jgi:chemotaxis protein CheX
MSSNYPLKEGIRLSLEPVLDMRAAAPLKDTLQQGLDQKRNLVIDASAVSRMSTACVQVLTAFILETKKTNTSLVFSKMSPVFEGAFSSLGLGEILETTKPQVMQ